MLEKMNYDVNSQVELPDGVINGQGCGKVSTMRYGFFPMSYNGCEMIAIYNLLYLEGFKGHRLDRICLEMYPKSGVLWGILGSDVFKLNKYYEMHDIEVMKFRSRDKFFEQLKKNKYGTISFWNHNNPFKGIHTVCVEYLDNNQGIRVYNRYNNKDYPYEYKTVDEVVSKSRFLSGYCLKK